MLCQKTLRDSSFSTTAVIPVFYGDEILKKILDYKNMVRMVYDRKIK